MNMKKSTAGVLAMVVMAVAMALIPAQEASAQSPVKSRTALDNWLKDAEYPYYIIANGPSLDAGGDALASAYVQLGQLPQIDGAYYITQNNILWICMDTKNGPKTVFLLVYETKEEALEEVNNKEEGIDKLGPFELGTSSSAMDASVQRILASVQSFIKTGVFPTKW